MSLRQIRRHPNSLGVALDRIATSSQRHEVLPRLQPQHPISWIQPDGVRIVRRGSLQPTAALTKPGKRSEFRSPAKTVNQRLAKTICSLVCLTLSFKQLAKSQPRRSKTRFQSKSAAILSHRVHRTIQLNQRLRHVLQRRNVLRIQLGSATKGN